MKKLLIVALACVFAAPAAVAQKQSKAQATQSTKIQPMFGNVAKSEAEQKQDEKFLTSCDKNFANRQEASSFFMERGWEYYNEGQIDTAMYRFNLAWLLNPGNKDTYWAFGLVTASQGDAEKAVDLFEKALSYDPKNSLLLSDLGASYLEVYKGKNKKKTLKKAEEYLSQAITTDTGNAYALYSYSKVKFYEKAYAEAWEYLHKSRGINLTQIDYGYLAELMEQMPDPQGFFKATDAAAGPTANK